VRVRARPHSLTPSGIPLTSDPSNIPFAEQQTQTLASRAVIRYPHTTGGPLSYKFGCSHGGNPAVVRFCSTLQRESAFSL